MGQDEDWVANVKRWVKENPAAVAGASGDETKASAGGDESGGDVWGYEAAHPALQARHWPDSSDL